MKFFGVEVRENPAMPPNAVLIYNDECAVMASSAGTVKIVFERAK